MELSTGFQIGLRLSPGSRFIAVLLIFCTLCGWLPSLSVLPTVAVHLILWLPPSSSHEGGVRINCNAILCVFFPCSVLVFCNPFFKVLPVSPMYVIYCNPPYREPHTPLPSSGMGKHKAFSYRVVVALKTGLILRGLQTFSLFSPSPLM